MIVEQHLMFSKGQALIATAVSTDTLDLGSDRDIAPGSPLWLVVQSRAAPGGTSPTIAISIETDDNVAFSSATTIYTHATLSAAAFASGTMIVIPWPWANERHNRVKYTLGGTDPTFTVDALLTPYHPRSWQAYPDGI